tara:strand:- start:494 stop:631 length:138 start_codon:yes stop_codon:yes gene_type:complete
VGNFLSIDFTPNLETDENGFNFLEVELDEHGCFDTQFNLKMNRGK